MSALSIVRQWSFLNWDMAVMVRYRMYGTTVWKGEDRKATNLVIRDAGRTRRDLNSSFRDMWHQSRETRATL